MKSNKDIGTLTYIGVRPVKPSYRIIEFRTWIHIFLHSTLWCSFATTLFLHLGTRVSLVFSLRVCLSHFELGGMLNQRSCRRYEPIGNHSERINGERGIWSGRMCVRAFKWTSQRISVHTCSILVIHYDPVVAEHLCVIWTGDCVHHIRICKRRTAWWRMGEICCFLLLFETEHKPSKQDLI